MRANRLRLPCLLLAAVLAVAGAAIFTLGRVRPAGAVTSLPATIRLVAGYHSVTDSSGQLWASDASDAVGGQLAWTRHTIAGAGTQALFQTHRYGMSGYRIPVQAGTYQVTLDFSENYWWKPGQRVFDISAQGQTVATNLDVQSEVGSFHAYQRTFSVTVTGATLNLGFVAHVDHAMVTSIQVVPTTVAATTTPAPSTSAPSTPAPSTPAPSTSAPTTSAPSTPAPTTPAPTTPAPTTTAPTPMITPEAYGATGNGVTDDTVALQEAFDNAPAGTAVYLAPGKVYAHSAVLHLRTEGLHVTGPGVLLATNEATSSVWIEADNVLLDGGMTIRTAHTTQRWGAWEQMGLRLFGHQGITVRDVTIDGSAAAGLYVGDQSANFVLDHVTVANTRADGIHMTDGSHNGQVTDPTVINSGDDGVAVVSYSQDGAPCHDITVTSPTVLGTSWGRGLSVVGGTNITETNVNVQRSDAAGVYIAAEGNPWFTAAPQNVTISGGQIVQANTDATIDHGAVLVMSGETGPTPSNVTISGLTITDTRASASRNFGVVVYGSAPSGVLFENLVVTGGPSNAYGGNAAQSSFEIRNVTHNGVLLPNQG